MIAGIFHAGSGLGNQLHRYVATRVLALDKDCDFSIVAPELFKGTSFMDLDMGVPFNEGYRIDERNGKVEALFDIINGSKNGYWSEKTNYYNPEFNFIEDNTIIDGEFQDERYFSHRLRDIDQWLKVEPLDIPDDLCIINFRGGEYALFPELFLPKEYWAEAKSLMLQKNINMRFEVHTDDPELAKQFFPDYKIIHDIGVNWRSLRYAKHAIIANSSFAIFPRLLSGGFTVAPRYWARHNTKEWSRPDNFYRAFTYI